MKNSVGVCVYVLAMAVSLHAAVLTDNFDAGLSSQNWQTFQINAADAPWTVSASTGSLEISKSADNDSATMYQHISAGLKSNFTLDGDFSISVNFNLSTFPLAPDYGWNEAIFMVHTEQGGDFYSLRYTNNINQRAEAFCNVNPYVINSVMNSAFSGSFKIIRQGSTMSAYIHNGSSELFIGQMSSQRFLGKAIVHLYAAQAWDYAGARPNTSLDINFDNFIATADIITPEPCTLALLVFGGILMSRRKKQK